jgi:long-subunit fatty acid transport protein
LGLNLGYQNTWGTNPIGQYFERTTTFFYFSISQGISYKFTETFSVGANCRILSNSTEEISNGRNQYNYTDNISFNLVLGLHF